MRTWHSGSKYSERKLKPKPLEIFPSLVMDITKQHNEGKKNTYTYTIICDERPIEDNKYGTRSDERYGFSLIQG